MKKLRFKFNKKLITAVNLFLIFTLMTVSVYSWFASQVNNTVDAYDIEVEANNALELSFDGETWGGTLNLANFEEGGKNVLDTMKFVEVTGDGETFGIPQLTQKSNYAVIDQTSTNWSDAVANRDYLQFTVYMRSKDPLSVYLGSESAATPSSSVVTGEDCGNKSTAKLASGAVPFSKDCVVGALRVSFKDTSNNRYIWITNPNFHLDNKIGKDEHSMVTNATSAKYTHGSNTQAVGYDFYWNNPYVHYYSTYGDSTGSCKIYDANKTLTSLPDTVNTTPSATTKVATLTKSSSTSEYYEGKTTFTVWIEGCDTEARRALIDGRFNLSLVLDSFEN